MAIVTDEEMGGDARISGRRIAVYHIVQYREAGYSPDEISAEFDIPLSEVEEALEYADDHEAEISHALRAAKV